MYNRAVVSLRKYTMVYLDKLPYTIVLNKIFIPIYHNAKSKLKKGISCLPVSSKGKSVKVLSEKFG